MQRLLINSNIYTRVLQQIPARLSTSPCIYPRGAARGSGRVRQCGTPLPRAHPVQAGGSVSKRGASGQRCAARTHARTQDARALGAYPLRPPRARSLVSRRLSRRRAARWRHARTSTEARARLRGAGIRSAAPRLHHGTTPGARHVAPSPRAAVRHAARPPPPASAH
jgi:hypothetical protein